MRRSKASRGPSLLGARIVRIPSVFAAFLIRQYRRFLSPLLGDHCRFFPSCAAYGEEAFLKKGFWRGGWLILRRITKCCSLHPGGFDPLE